LRIIIQISQKRRTDKIISNFYRKTRKVNTGISESIENTVDGNSCNICFNIISSNISYGKTTGNGSIDIAGSNYVALRRNDVNIRGSRTNDFIGVRNSWRTGYGTI